MSRISLIGSGMLGINQIIIKDFSVIRSVNRVFWIGDIAGLNECLSHYEIPHEDLSHFYEDGGVDVDNYTRIIQYISNMLTECWLYRSWSPESRRDNRSITTEIILGRKFYF